MCIVCVLCLIVVPLPPGENTFVVKINNNNNIIKQQIRNKRREQKTKKRRKKPNTKHEAIKNN
jgi:hypothetical protein